MKETYTTFDIARMLDVYPNTVANWIDEEKIKAYITPGGHRRVKREDLLNFLIKHKMPVPDELKKKKSILVIEQNQEELEEIIKSLEGRREEFDIVTATDGFQAGEAFTMYTPDIAILDVEMNGSDGYRVCTEMRQRSRKLKILALIKGRGKQKTIKAGADDVITKPVNKEEFSKKLQVLAG